MKNITQISWQKWATMVAITLPISIALSSVGIDNLYINIASSILATISAFLILGLIASIGYSAFQYLTDDDKDEIDETVDTLNSMISNINERGTASEQMINDVKLQTHLLVDIVKNLARKSADIKRSRESLTDVLDAINSGDYQRIRIASGRIVDEHIAELFTIEKECLTDRYWDGVIDTVLIEIGSLEKWQAEYEVMSSRLIYEIQGIKKNLAAIEASVEVLRISKPLLTAKSNIDSSIKVLNAPSHLSLEAPKQKMLQ